MSDETTRKRAQNSVIAECEAIEERVRQLKTSIDAAQAEIDRLSPELAEQQDKLLDLYRKRLRTG